MEEINNLLLSTCFAFIGWSLGALITRRLVKKDKATATTLRLYDEWNSESMLATRHAIQEVREFFDRDEKNNLESRHRSLRPEDRAGIWKIIYFYEKLFVLIDNKECDEKLIPDLFGETFYWWYRNCFEAKLVPLEYRTSAIRILNLKNWLEEKSPLKILEWKKREAATTKSDYQVVRNNPE